MLRTLVLTVAVAAVASSELKMTGENGKSVGVTFDGTTLTVPQHCRQDTCDSLANEAAADKLIIKGLLDQLSKSHPCRDGSHKCDKTVHGKCFEVSGGYNCDCVTGYHNKFAVSNDVRRRLLAPPAPVLHECVKSTSSPTPAPSPGCIDNVSFYVYATNECVNCPANCAAGSYRFGCGHGSAGQCAACSTPSANAHHSTSGTHGDASSCAEECDSGYRAHGSVCALITASPTPVPVTPAPTPDPVADGMKTGDTSEHSLGNAKAKCLRWNGSICEQPAFWMDNNNGHGWQWHRLYTNNVCSGTAAKMWCKVVTGSDSVLSHTSGPKGSAHGHMFRATAGYSGRSCVGDNNHHEDDTFTAGGYTISLFPQHTNNQYYDHIQCTGFA
jgi:hypothetical protein